MTESVSPPARMWLAFRRRRLRYSPHFWQFFTAVIPVVVTLYFQSRLTRVQHDFNQQLADRQGDISLTQEYYRRKVAAYEELYRKATTLSAVLHEYVLDQTAYTRATDATRDLYDTAIVQAIYMSPEVASAVENLRLICMDVLETRDAAQLPKLPEATRGVATAMVADLQIKRLGETRSELERKVVPERSQ